MPPIENWPRPLIVVACLAAIAGGLAMAILLPNPLTTPKVEKFWLGFKVAVHIYYLDDAKALLRAGADFIAHSVRDLDIDEEFIKHSDLNNCA